jgi:hypothetical protein
MIDVSLLICVIGVVAIALTVDVMAAVASLRGRKP